MVKLAQTAGFCMGVRRAVDKVLHMARSSGSGPIYTYGELIHNPPTVELLKRRGIIPIESLDDIDRGTVVVRAHGISPREREKLKEKNITLVDATCPKVARVQAIIKKHVSMGYNVVIVGNADHPEVRGLLGYAEPGGIVVADVEDVDRLPELEKVCVVAQTTRNRRHYEEVCSRMKERFPEVLVFNTICDSTERRQAEVLGMTGEVDVMIIVGGRNSSNTKELLDISRRSGTPTFQVETAEELRDINLDKAARVGVSAGASTPNWITDSVVDYLTLYRGKEGNFLMNALVRLWLFAIRTDIYSAVGAGILSSVSMILQGRPLSLINILIAAFYVYSMHTFNRIQDRYLGRIQGSFRDETYLKHKKIYLWASVISLALAFLLSLAAGKGVFFFLMLMSLAGYLYRFRMFPLGLPLKSLRDIPGSKNIFIALGWAVVAALIPPLAEGDYPGITAVLSFVIVFTLVFMKSIISDMVTVQSDQLVGRETFPVVMGERNSGKLVRWLSMALGLFIVAVGATGLMPPIILSLLTVVFYVWICLELCDKRAKFSSTALEGFFGTTYIVAGAAVFAGTLVARLLNR